MARKSAKVVQDSVAAHQFFAAQTVYGRKIIAQVNHGGDHHASSFVTLEKKPRHVSQRHGAAHVGMTRFLHAAQA